MTAKTARTVQSALLMYLLAEETLAGAPEGVSDERVIELARLHVASRVHYCRVVAQAEHEILTTPVRHETEAGA